MTSNVIYIGLKAHVVAIEKASGVTLWNTKLKARIAPAGDGYVSLLVEHGLVYAHSYGELFCLDAETGEILWKNELEGLGFGLASLATDGLSNSSAASIAHLKKKKKAGSAALLSTVGGASFQR